MFRSMSLHMVIIYFSLYCIFATFKKKFKGKLLVLMNVMLRHALRTVHPIYRTGVPLPSRCCILYIFSTIISTEYFKHAARSPFFSSKCRLFHNATLFGSCIIHIDMDMSYTRLLHPKVLHHRTASQGRALCESQMTSRVLRHTAADMRAHNVLQGTVEQLR
jgi:hypothetical protein